ncbi:hypothetical protein NYZ99_17995 [Maribacter litopenaei]|uniref:Uncharacterized protein n=1 Tax=Maribacter litopenaei TaxID=2976127 RepID=A0ABY5Y9S2_9FLAO|nr:hypothetical protein [Maribacter litopenaei]UWX54706.1 hypothetical protein NYZ99_17995 [Maribacter litopenaei]
MFASTDVNAQLGFCTGNSGDPIFTEDFGSGTLDGPALPLGTTTYNFTTGIPNDGDYTISSTTNYFDWHNTPRPYSWRHQRKSIHRKRQFYSW